jgi:predicted nucleic acid-binding protein
MRTESVARKRYVLDTSALFTLIEEEDGADRVEEIVSTEDAYLPSLALLEVHYVTRQERGQGEADRRYALLKKLPCEILWQVDEPTLLTASRFKAAHRLSLADALIAATAIRQEAVLLHKDPEYEALAEVVELEALPYKARKKGS